MGRQCGVARDAANRIACIPFVDPHFGHGRTNYRPRVRRKPHSIEIDEMPIEAHNSIGKVERYHGPLRRAYDIITDSRNGPDTLPIHRLPLQADVRVWREKGGWHGP